MNIYILTEEKPKLSTVLSILDIYKKDYNIGYSCASDMSIFPIIKNNKFTFKYILRNVDVDGIENIYIKIVSGGSSFLDFLFFVQNDEPKEGSMDNLIFAVEETKTSDDESRNTGVYQRCSKFVYIQTFSKTPLYMLYNDELNLREEKKPSATSIFGTNMMLTNGVKICGKPMNKWFKKFKTVDELIEEKNNMRKPPVGNIPIEIIKEGNKITISGRLDKPKNLGRISHDPNIGALSYISYTLRNLGWSGEIEIIDHQIKQEYITENTKNKFISICKMLNLSMRNITLPKNYHFNSSYWHYENRSEKVASIFLHILGESLGFKEIYQNHAGCERGYFKTLDNILIALPKYCGDDNHNLLIPDLIIRDDEQKTIYLIEGKKLSTINAGILEIENYDDIETLYVNKYFPHYKVHRYLTIFGGNLSEIPNEKVLLYINDCGDIFINGNVSKLNGAVSN